MALDIFSNFDDHNKVTLATISPLLIWTPLLLLHKLKYWRTTSPYTAFYLTWTGTISNIITRTQARKIGASYSFFVTWRTLILWLNLMGLVPYVFRLTRHLAINLRLALPIWLLLVIISTTFNLNNYLSHFQPIGSPAPLNPFLCIIELIRNLVRPITLAVRLAANLRTGHIIFALLGRAFTRSSFITSAFLLTTGFFYTFFEGAVCIIQTYIFTLLPTLYRDDHPSS